MCDPCFGPSLLPLAAFTAAPSPHGSALKLQLWTNCWPVDTKTPSPTKWTATKVGSGGSRGHQSSLSVQTMTLMFTSNTLYMHLHFCITENLNVKIYFTKKKKMFVHPCPEFGHETNQSQFNALMHFRYVFVFFLQVSTKHDEVWICYFYIERWI